MNIKLALGACGISRSFALHRHIALAVLLLWQTTSRIRRLQHLERNAAGWLCIDVVPAVSVCCSTLCRAMSVVASSSGTASTRSQLMVSQKGANAHVHTPPSVPGSLHVAYTNHSCKQVKCSGTLQGQGS